MGGWRILGFDFSINKNRLTLLMVCSVGSQQALTLGRRPVSLQERGIQSQLRTPLHQSCRTQHKCSGEKGNSEVISEVVGEVNNEIWELDSEADCEVADE